MNTLFFFLALLAIGATVSSAGIVIYNANGNANIATVDYSAPFPGVVGPVYVPNCNATVSTYNYLTNSLTFIRDVSGTESFVTANTADTNSTNWKFTYGTSNYQIQIEGLSSDQTKYNNIYGAYTKTGNTNIYIFQYVTQITSSYYYWRGSYRGQVFVPSLQTYFVAYTNGTGLYMKSFNTRLQYLSEVKVSFANNLYPITDTPLNLVLNLANNAIIATVQMTDNTGDVVYGLATYDLTTSTFLVNRMYGYSNDVFTATSPAMNNYLYTFAIDSMGQNYLYTWSLYTNTFLTYRSFPETIIGAF